MSTELVTLNTDDTSSAEPVKSKKFAMSLDKVVIALIVSGMILFASFQIRDSVSAHQNPKSQISTISRPRLFPGIMICPFGSQVLDSSFEYDNFINTDDFFFCPKWSDDALLSFDFGTSNPSVFNTNYNAKSGRQGSVCPKNNEGVVSGGKTMIFQSETLRFRDMTGSDTEYTQYVTVKSKPSSRPSSQCRGSITQTPDCRRCSSWMPPNVRCLVYDPSFFNSMAPKDGIDPICNPMSEGKDANVLDSLHMSDVKLDDGNDKRNGNQGFRYTGLIQQPTVSEVGRADSELFVSFFDLKSEFARRPSSGPVPRNPWNTTFFDGLVTIFYDSSKGIPKELDFATAAYGSPGEGLFSTVLLKTFSLGSGGSGGKILKLVTPSVDVDIFDVNFDLSFSNVVLQSYADMSTRFDIRVAAHQTKPGVQRPSDFFTTVINMQFVSSTSMFRQEYINFSILTTISIILTTATTAWSAREKFEQIITWFIFKCR